MFKKKAVPLSPFCRGASEHSGLTDTQLAIRNIYERVFGKRRSDTQDAEDRV
jgi:hypothetical protein